MTDTDPFYAPGRTSAPRGPRPGEPLWAFGRADQHTWSCELRDHGAVGVEAQILKDGELVIGRRFDTRALAVQWAAEERKAIERGDDGSDSDQKR
jgi:hypothetical protein